MKALFVGLIYLILAKISFFTTLSSSPAGPAMIWLPTGFAVAVLLTEGYRVWPGILLGSLLNSNPNAVGWGGVLGFVLANTLDPVIAAWLPKRILKRDLDLSCHWDCTVFILVTFFVSSVFSASVGLFTMILGNLVHVGSYVTTWLIWWVSDLLGVLVLFPLLMAFRNGHGFAKGRADWKEIVLGRVLSVAIITVIFAMPLGRNTLHFVYWIVPVVIWQGFRLGIRQVTAGVFFLAFIIIVATSLGKGPFLGSSTAESFLYVQSFLTVISVLALLVSAVVSEREKAVLNRDELFLLASHELKTPLTILGLQSQLLKELVEKEELDHLDFERRIELVRISYKETKRLETLVEDLLEGARIAAGKLDVRPVKMDLVDLVDSVIREQSEEIQRQGVQVNVSGDSITGDWDRRKLGYVVKALLMNAVKFGAGNSVDVTTELRGRKAVLTVEDRGIGISKKQRSKIFERFGRLARVESFGGLGQGLFIAKAVVIAHRGAITVESNPGRGTKVIVELPVEFQGVN